MNTTEIRAKSNPLCLYSGGDEWIQGIRSGRLPEELGIKVCNIVGLRGKAGGVARARGCWHLFTFSHITPVSASIIMLHFSFLSTTVSFM